MKPSIVNGYVLPKLFYELIFVRENFGDIDNTKWEDDYFVDSAIMRFVSPRYAKFSERKKKLVRDTLRYLLAHETSESDVWDTIWEASALSFPTPHGIKHFVRRCHDVLFDNEPLPSPEELNHYVVKHDMTSPDLIR